MRRTRYRVTAERAGQGRSWDVLAYSRESALRFLERQGYYNIEMTTGRRRPVGSGQPARWEIDRTALKRACAMLGITWEVKITRTTARGRTGSWTMSPERHTAKVHRITANKLSDLETANRTLWHELTHAAQCERVGGTWAQYFAHHRREHGYPYTIRPCEVEARANAEQYGHIMLVRPAGKNA